MLPFVELTRFIGVALNTVYWDYGGFFFLLLLSFESLNFLELLLTCLLSWSFFLGGGKDSRFGCSFSALEQLNSDF